LLAFAFPPSRAIGAVRCWNLAKHLSRCGWEVEVVTPDPALLTDRDSAADINALCRAAKVTRRLTQHDWRFLMGGYLVPRWWEKGRLLQKASSRLARALWIGTEAGWTSAAWRSCAGLHPGDADVILASGPPYGAFALAARLSGKLQAPFILDYRDLWTLSPHRPGAPPPWLVRRERKLLAEADAVVVVSEAMAACLRQRFGLASPPHVTTNGFDPEDFAGIEPAAFEDFALVYAGNFYRPKRVIEPVLAAIKLANQNADSSHRPIRLHYYGRETSYVNEAAQAAGARLWTVTHGVVSRRSVLAAMKGAGAAAVITSVEAHASPQDNSILTGKLFEALGAGAPVLLVAPPDTEVVRVVETSRGGRAFAGTQVAEMAGWLRQLADGRADSLCSRIETYSWPLMAERLDGFLRALIPIHGANRYFPVARRPATLSPSEGERAG
jgi:hypothetical protein